MKQFIWKLTCIYYQKIRVMAGSVTWFVVVDVEVEDGHNSDGQKRGPPVNDEHNDETEQRTNKAEPQ